MEMSGEERIAAPRQRVWEALNDPEILKQCIPGCEEMEKTEDGGFAAKVKAKVGPVSAKFSGKVTLSNLNPPESYTISGEGTGGAAGFAKGGADVQLKDEGESTLLSYQVNASVGGKLAQIGQRLVKGTAEKYANQFFSRFGEIVAGEQAQETKPAEASGATAATASASPQTAETTEPQAAAAPASPTTPAPPAAEPAAHEPADQAPARESAPDGTASATAPGESAPAETIPKAATSSPDVESFARPTPGAEETPGEPEATPAAREAARKEAGRGVKPAIWIAGLVAAIIVLLLIFTA